MTVQVAETPTVVLSTEICEPTLLEENELQRRVTNFLVLRGIPESQSLEVEADYGTVIVRGRLPSLHAKWLCLECCRHVAGVMAVVDDLEVGSWSDPQSDEDGDVRRRRPR